MSQRLPDVIEEFLRSRKAQGFRPNTITNEQRSLDRLLAYLGPIQVRHIEERHIDEFLAREQGRGLSAGTLNVTLQALRNFFKFCVRRGYMRVNVAAHRRLYRQVPRSRLRIPASDFPRLLDACDHPRDRMLFALGIYLWLRDSEATDLRVGDVDLRNGSVTVRIHKTNQIDVMPISYELDKELRRWLSYYSTDLGTPLKSDMLLVPAKSRPRGKDPVTGHYRAVPGDEHLRPYAKITRTYDPIKKVLERCGYPVTLESGRGAMEGMHTLRRSGARARFDFLVSQGYDGAIKEVQAGLHHKSVQTTERYLGLDLDAHRRYHNIRGQHMYGESALDNVVDLEGHREQARHHRHSV